MKASVKAISSAKLLSENKKNPLFCEDSRQLQFAGGIDPDMVAVVIGEHGGGGTLLEKRGL